MSSANCENILIKRDLKTTFDKTDTNITQFYSQYA